jgi:hypothetical protein
MERQAGLGRSLEDVLDSLTPAEPDAPAPGRVLFEPEDLEQQLDQLMGDIRDLRERVQHLVGMVTDEALAETPTTQALSLVEAPPRTKSKKKSGKKQVNKKQVKKKQVKKKRTEPDPTA